MLEIVLTPEVLGSPWRLQTCASQLEPLLNLFDMFYQNVPRTSRRPRASCDGVNVWSLSYTRILREINHYWNVKWTMKHSLHYWDYIIKFIIIAYYTQYIYLFLLKDEDVTRNININVYR